MTLAQGVMLSGAIFAVSSAIYSNGAQQIVGAIVFAAGVIAREIEKKKGGDA